jgi:hypothetical protein
MPRDEQSRRRARNHARIALIMCVVMFAALTPVFAALSKGAISSARAQPPLPTCGFPPIMECPEETPSPSGSASASRSPSASASASRSPSTSPSSSASPSQSPSATPTPSQTSASPSRSPSPTPTISPSRTPQTFNSPSEITIKHRKGTKRFRGKVTSDFDECEAGRLVKLFYVVPGFGTARSVGKTQTRADGGWTINEKNPEGKYFASVKPRSITTPAGDTINCRKDRSRRVTG